MLYLCHSDQRLIFLKILDEEDRVENTLLKYLELILWRQEIW